MDFTWLLVFIFFKNCSCVTLDEIADSLQNVERMLRKENECKIQCGEKESLQSHLQEYIDQKISEHFDNELNTHGGLVTKDGLQYELERFFNEKVRKHANTEKVLHAFASEKNIRKKMEKEILFVRSSLLETEVLIRSIKNDILALDGDKKLLKEANNNIKEEVDKLKSIILDRTKINEMISENNGVCKSLVETLNTSVTLELKKVKTELGVAVEQRNRRQVVFSAIIKYGKSYNDIKPWQTIIFGQVDLNVGQAYSGETGKFTAPVDGVYVFHVHITGSDNRGLEICMSKNAQTILLLYVKGPGHGTDGGNIAIQLKKGDVVSVDKYGPWGNKPFYIHHVFSSFTGFLLYETNTL